MSTAQHQFVYNEQGKKTFALLPIAEYEALISAHEIDTETQHWLEADMGEDLPEYDWGEKGIPAGQPIQYQAGIGFVR
jgi:hypothetical protein